MNKKRGSGSGLFLMEMIMVVGFFILCASICVSVFVKANQMSRNAQDTNRSVMMAQSVMEVWKAGGQEGLMVRFPAVPLDGSDGTSYLCYWDGDWAALADGGAAAFYGRFDFKLEDGIEDLSVTIGRGGRQGDVQPGQDGPLTDGSLALYQLTGSRYGGTGGDMD